MENPASFPNLEASPCPRKKEFKNPGAQAGAKWHVIPANAL
jgi:hypothetical protein